MAKHSCWNPSPFCCMALGSSEEDVAAVHVIMLYENPKARQMFLVQTGCVWPWFAHQTLQGHFYHSLFLSQSQLLSYPSSHCCQAHSNPRAHSSVTHFRSPGIVPSPGGMGKGYFVISALQTGTRQWCSTGKHPWPRLHIIPSLPALCAWTRAGPSWKIPTVSSHLLHTKEATSTGPFCF